MNPKRILIVEDNSELADCLSEVLQSCGYQTCPVAKSYDEAISYFEIYNPDLVTLDIHIEGERTGIDVAKYIKQNSNIPFIYLSGSIDRSSISLVKATNPFAFLVKPYEFLSLETTLKSAFNSTKPTLKTTQVEKRKLPKFTPMEKVILKEVANGLTSQKIASRLDLSASTIKNHRHNICVKLKLPRTTHSLLNWALENKRQLNL
ncbi:hypothetical protein MB14_12465 [Roseivirga ehrenbergii]|uniref:Two-component system response regulator n=1 Tax=Roseivirga ehrenbergii (strain DSM 102268 / JCM 13514 / KCTC 12282 / NCIMB 14502 / KMM 6017) TaxID=279360 RepID=A0A150XRR3_ROSEK|nr:hypothetical protein MB14_12465 [Roseivirga ehrenbergii]